jgi:hypothetical protein
MHDQLLDGKNHTSSAELVGFEVEKVPGFRKPRPSLHWEHLNPLPGIACSSELFGIGLGKGASPWIDRG